MKIRFIINGLGVVLLFLSLLFSCSKENSIKIEVLPTLFIVDSFQVIKTDMGTI